jgi:hypothetical protein
VALGRKARGVRIPAPSALSVTDLRIRSGATEAAARTASVTIQSLMAYGPNLPDMYKRAVTYIDGF